MGTPCQIDVKLAKPEGRKNATIKDRNGSTYKAPVFKVRSLLLAQVAPTCGRRVCWRKSGK